MFRVTSQLRRTATVVPLALVLALALPATALAADIRSGETIVIAADEVIDDDLFLSGNRVEMNGTVKGDLFAAGAEVVVNGTVEGSLFVAGQTLEVNGPVRGSVYGGGYTLETGPQADIARNLFFGGFSLSTAAGSTVGRSLYGGGYQLLLDGEVAQDVSVGAGALELNGKVGGDVTGEVSEPDQTATPPTMGFPGAAPAVAPGLRIGDEAEIGGQVDVQLVAPDADGRQPGIGERILRAFVRRLGEFIALLIVGGLLLWRWPDAVERVGSTVQTRLLESAGNGLLVFIAFWLLALAAVLVVVIVWIVTGLITLGQLGGRLGAVGGGTIYLSIATFLFVVALVTKMIVAFLVGKIAMERLAPQVMEGRWGVAVALLVGVLVYEIIRAIPVLGWIVGVLVTLVGLGAIYLTFRGERTLPAEVIATA